jgi:membrane-bound lytic murein transglycosylase
MHPSPAYSATITKTLKWTRAYDSAFADKGDGTYEGVGHVMFYRGEVSDEDGVLA